MSVTIQVKQVIYKNSMRIGSAILWDKCKVKKNNNNNNKTTKTQLNGVEQDAIQNARPTLRPLFWRSYERPSPPKNTRMSNRSANKKLV